MARAIGGACGQRGPVRRRSSGGPVGEGQEGIAMLLKRRGPLPVLALALALVGVSEGVAAAQTPREVALKYAVDNAQAFGVTPADVANLTVTYEYRSAHNGVTH